MKYSISNSWKRLSRNIIFFRMRPVVGLLQPMYTQSLSSQRPDVLCEMYETLFRLKHRKSAGTFMRVPAHGDSEGKQTGSRTGLWRS